MKRNKESGVNPPFNRTSEDRMSKGELREYHSKYGHMGDFYELYGDERPQCMGVLGCPCPGCCKMRGRMMDRER